MDYTDDPRYQCLVIDPEQADSSAIDLDRIAEEIIPNLDDMDIQPIQTKNLLEGIIQLLILKTISEKLKGDTP